MNKKQNNAAADRMLGKAPVPKLLLKMAVPMVIAMVVNGLYYLVDAAFVGLAVGASALGGLAVVFPLQMLAVALATMIGVGTSSIISRRMGAGDSAGASAAVKNAIMYAGILGVIIPVLLILFKPAVLGFMGASASTIADADAYYSVIIPGFLLIFLSFLEVNTIRAEGNAKLAAFGMFFGSVLNIGFDALFIFVFKMGTAGAAWGTVTARLITTILLTRYYVVKKSTVGIMTRGWKPNGRLIREISMLGIGSLFNQLGFAVLAVVMNLLLGKYGTDTDMAVFGVIARILVFVTMPLMGVAQGFQPIVGYSHGAGDPGRIKQAIRTAYLYAFVLGLIMLAFILVTPQGVLGLFTNDSAIITGGADALRISLMMTPLIGWQLIAYFYFMSVGRPLPSLVIALFRQVIFILPLLAVLPLFLGLGGVWIAYPIADVLSVAAATLMVVRARRKATAAVSTQLAEVIS